MHQLSPEDLQLVDVSFAVISGCGGLLVLSAGRLQALVDGRVLCVHGGLSPDLRTLDQVRSPSYPCSACGVSRGVPSSLLSAERSASVSDI